MRHGTLADYTAPFRDRIHDSRESEIARVVSIGRERLLAWWERTRGDTYPGTFGHSGHEFTSGVAYLVAGGVIARTGPDDDSEPQVIACRALGVEPNWRGDFADVVSADDGPIDGYDY